MAATERRYGEVPSFMVWFNAKIKKTNSTDLKNTMLDTVFDGRENRLSMVFIRVGSPTSING